jgi:hypothetical protein
MPVPDFSPGEVLTAAAMDSIGLWLVKTQTIGTGVSDVTVTGAFSADYENYYITITGGVGSGTSGMALRLGSTNTGYYGAGQKLTYAGVSTVNNTNNGSSFGFTGVCTTDNIFFSVNLFMPNLAKRTFLTSNFIFGDPAGGGDNTFLQGYVNNTTQYTAFTVLGAGATLTGGTIRVYGYRN